MISLRSIAKFVLVPASAVYLIHIILQTSLDSIYRQEGSMNYKETSSYNVTSTRQINTEYNKNQTSVAYDYDYKGAHMEDPRLINYIRRELLHPPSQLPYNLKAPQKVDSSQYGQSRYANDNILHGMRGGFFIEAGALNGEHLSNTLYFERELGWTGLLIEPNPEKYDELRKKHRKAFTINAALSTTQVASELSLRIKGRGSGLSHLAKNGTKVKGIPLYSILLALDVKVVDFFSLDIEGLEHQILHTIPWDKVKFRLMCIESNQVRNGRSRLEEYLTGVGYKYIGARRIDSWFGWPALLNETMQS